MVDFETLKREIDLNYKEIKSGNITNMNRIYDLLRKYIRKTIEKTIMYGGYVDQNAVEDLMQDTLLDIFEKGIYTYREQGKSFAGYCCMIARNKAIDFTYKRRRENVRLVYSREGSEFKDEHLDYVVYHNMGEVNSITDSPEKRIIELEQQLEYADALKKYLLLIMDQRDKPYKVVGYCYTVILYQIYNPSTKTLSSPTWAFEEMKEETIQYSADRFLKEFNNRLSRGRITWGPHFIDQMDEEEYGILISDMIFQEHFTKKDLENWTVRLRNKLRKQLCMEYMSL